MSLSAEELRRKFEQRSAPDHRTERLHERRSPTSRGAAMRGPSPTQTPDYPQAAVSAPRQSPRPAPIPQRVPNRHRRAEDREPAPAETPQYRETSDSLALGRPAQTLRRAWIDPEETPFEPIPRPGNPLATRILSWVFMAVFVGGIAWLVVPEVSFRIANADTLVLHDGVLTAHPVPLAPTRPATVTELYVDASALPDSVLAAGTPIARLEGLSETSRGYEAFELRAPFDARFVSVDSLVGAVALPGTPVATVYDPSKMYVIVSVEPQLLEQLRRGMQVELKSDVIEEPVQGSVISAVPLLGTDHEPSSADLVNVRIRPDPQQIADFVPGIHFDAAVDLTSAPPDAQPLVFTNASHSASRSDATNDQDSIGTSRDSGAD